MSYKINTTLFEGFVPRDDVSLRQIAEWIVSGRYKMETEQYRRFLAEGNEKAAEWVKENMCAVSVSALLLHHKDGIERYSGFVNLSFNNLLPEKLETLRTRFDEVPYTAICFKNLDGSGLNVWVKANTGMEHHSRAYGQAKAYYEKVAEEEARGSHQNISDLCFVSWDPDACLRDNFELFPVDLTSPVIEETLPLCGGFSDERAIDLSSSPIQDRLLGYGYCSDESQIVFTPSPSLADQNLCEQAPAPNESTVDLPLSASFAVENPPEQAPVAVAPAPEIEKPEGNPFDVLANFEAQIEYANRVKIYEKGKSSYVYLLACNCNRKGMPQKYVERQCLARYSDLSEKTIRDAVKRAYSHREAHGTWAQGQKSGILQEKLLPVLSDRVFESSTLPDVVKRIVGVADGKEERDALFFSGMAALSAVFPMLYVRIRGNRAYANYYTIIFGPSACGKGVAAHCRKLAEPIDKKLKAQTERTRKRRARAKRAESEGIRGFERVPQKRLIFDGNITAAGLTELLSYNKEGGLIFETETDALNLLLRSGGGYALRQYSQNEYDGYYRQKGQESIEVSCPRLSLFASGTEGQVIDFLLVCAPPKAGAHKRIGALLPGIENGIYNRILVYKMNQKPGGDSFAHDDDEDDLPTHFEKLGKEFFDFYEKFRTKPELFHKELRAGEKIRFSLTPEQQIRFNEVFGDMDGFYFENDKIFLGSPRRLREIALKQLMIFSGLRIKEGNAVWGKNETEILLLCREDDFENIMAMVPTFLAHSEHLFTAVSGRSLNGGYRAGTEQKKKEQKKKEFLEKLPDEFKRNIYLDAASKLKIGDTTAQGYIRELEAAGVIKRMENAGGRKIRDRYFKVSGLSGDAPAAGNAESTPLAGDVPDDYDEYMGAFMDEAND